MPPVVYGLSSGRTALPRSALATGAPNASAMAVTSARAPRQPRPTSMATLDPAFRTSAARRSSSGAGIG